jgi:predicted phage-related endonuclease
LEIAPIRLYDDAWLPPEDSDDLKYASSEVDLKLEELVKLQTERKNIEKQEELLKADIMDYMGSSYLLKSNTGYKISWKPQTQHRVNIELLKKQQPEIYNRFVCNINIRPFKLLKEKV